MRTSNLRATVAMGGVFLFIFLLSFGCGNPEAPQITKVRLSYWDSLTGDGSWVFIEDGEVAPQSPVRIQGNLTDNTAVVNPRIHWIGDRDDVDEARFVECSEGTKEFYECEMSCEETHAGFFECNPLLPARRLIRGDLFLLTMVTSEGEEYELEIQVSEAQDLLIPESESDPVRIREDYRILRVLSLTKGPNPFLWSLLQRKVAGGPWLPLRSGDVLALGSGDDAFQIAIEVPEGVALDVPPSATWRSLVKWNDKSFLDWDATTGDFVEKFQVFDPRDRQDMIGGVGASTYRYVVSAEDVPDQKTEVFRYSQVVREIIFSPEMATREPDLEVKGEDKELVKTSKSAGKIKGKVRSFSGEVRSLAFRLSDGAEGRRNRLLYFKPTGITLVGKFSTTIMYVSDWDGDGVVDEWNKKEGIPNTLDAVALDVQGNWTYTTVSIGFRPSTKKVDRAPGAQDPRDLPCTRQKPESIAAFRRGSAGPCEGCRRAGSARLLCLRVYLCS